MNLTLHHINLCTDNVEEMDAFYQDVLGLNRETNDLPVLEKKKGIYWRCSVCIRWKYTDAFGSTG